jgi:hypothetical protein
MHRHDPLAPIARAEMHDRWQHAERARLCYAAQERRSPGGERRATMPPAAGWVRRVVRLIRGSVPATSAPWMRALRAAPACYRAMLPDAAPELPGGD